MSVAVCQVSDSPSAGKDDFQQQVPAHSEVSNRSSTQRRDLVDLDLQVDQDPDDGDSFFDDPLPKPQKTYGW